MPQHADQRGPHIAITATAGASTISNTRYQPASSLEQQKMPQPCRAKMGLRPGSTKHRDPFPWSPRTPYLSATVIMGLLPWSERLAANAGCMNTTALSPAPSFQGTSVGHSGQRISRYSSSRTASQAFTRLMPKPASLVWHITLEDHLVPLYSGTPLVTDDTVFVPDLIHGGGAVSEPFLRLLHHQRGHGRL